jgi:hypothetical protein
MRVLTFLRHLVPSYKKKPAVRQGRKRMKEIKTRLQEAESRCREFSSWISSNFSVEELEEASEDAELLCYLAFLRDVCNDYVGNMVALEPIQVVNARYDPKSGDWIDRKHSVLGNIFTHLDGPTLAAEKVETRDESIEKYKPWLVEQLHDPNSDASREIQRLFQKWVREGKLTLICWCHPAKCHGDIIKELLHAVAEKKGMTIKEQKLAIKTLNEYAARLERDADF